MESIGKIINGTVSGKVQIRLKSTSKVDVGDLLTCKDKNSDTFFLKIVNLGISSLISDQFIEDIAGQKLEHGMDYELFDNADRFYKFCEAKVLKIQRDGKFVPPRSVPNFFVDVYPITDENFGFVNTKGEIPIGHLRLGTNKLESVTISLPAKSLISHHMLVSAATGKGKSNFAKVFLRGILYLDNYASIVFDPHNEYHGSSGNKGLRDHPLKEKILYLSPRYHELHSAEQLKIYTEDLSPEDFTGIIDLSPAQQEAMDVASRILGKKWIKDILKTDTEVLFNKFEGKIHRATIATLKRKISHSLELDGTSGLIFDVEDKVGRSIYDKIKSAISERKLIIIDTSMVGEESERIISSSVLSKIFNSYRHAKQTKPQEFSSYPEVLVLFEEAPRVLGTEALSKGTNVFERIAREGRKFKVGLCAITQMPSLLSREILSQMNTKVILGLPAPMDRDSVVNSASQDISDEATEIQMLDKGEAIITSPFIDFPVPVKIFKFEETLDKDSKSSKPTAKLPNIGLG